MAEKGQRLGVRALGGIAKAAAPVAVGLQQGVKGLDDAVIFLTDLLGSQDLVLAPAQRVQKPRILQPVGGKPVPGDEAVLAVSVRPPYGNRKLPQPIAFLRRPAESLEGGPGGCPRPPHGRDKELRNRLTGHARHEQRRLPLAGRGQAVVFIIRVTVPNQ